MMRSLRLLPELLALILLKPPAKRRRRGELTG